MWQPRLAAPVGLLLLLHTGWASAGLFYDSPSLPEMVANGTVSTSNSCCHTLSLVFGDDVSLPGVSSFAESLQSYWTSQESEVIPNCVFTPVNSQDVSLAIAILNRAGKRYPECDLAIRSGGHTPFAGSANIDRGITIDMRRINHIDLTEDKKLVRLGPGNRWVDVYQVLDKEGLSTPGGRAAPVGVGGLTLGGGISFFSARYGFVCDNVENFEVVLSSGQVVNANATSNPDLWRALRGGSKNFGVVTSIDLRVFPQGKFWGGMIVNDISTRHTQFKLFEDFAGNPDYDEYGALIHSLSYNQAMGRWILANFPVYTKDEEYPAVFKPFADIPQLHSTMRTSNLSDFTREIAATTPNGRRNLFATSTYKNSAQMMETFFNIANETLESLPHIDDLRFSISFQPMPAAITGKGALNGGNSLGLDPAIDGVTFNTLLTATWDKASDDELMNKQAMTMFDRANAAAREMGVYRSYQYLNYAAVWQDPFAGYGAENKLQLQKVSQKYDPDQMFQRQAPGGFRLFP